MNSAKRAAMDEKRIVAVVDFLRRYWGWAVHGWMYEIGEVEVVDG